MKTACCDYQCKDDDRGPVFTNTGNNMVQCHNCGEVYVKISDLTTLRERLTVADAKLSRLSQLADSWSDRGGYAKGVFAKDLRNVLAGTVGGGPQPMPAAPDPQALPSSQSGEVVQ